ENSSGALSAQMRALVSQPRGAAPSGPAEASAAPPRKESSDAAIAGKPSGSTLDERERVSRVGDDSIARSLERARRLVDPAPAALDAAATPPPKVEIEEAPAKPPDPILAAFNALLGDCGFDRWHLLSAEAVPDDHALRHVVLVHSNPSGTATGSLSCDRLTLE